MLENAVGLEHCRIMSDEVVDRCFWSMSDGLPRLLASILSFWTWIALEQRLEESKDRVEGGSE
jgi:hypothetical protein